MGYKYEKEDILNTGYEVLRKNGYHNVGINQILKEAGIPKGSFYNFFESKEDFAYQVIEHYGQHNLNWLNEQLSQEGAALDVLKNFYQGLINMNEADAYSSGCLINMMSIEVAKLNDHLAKIANHYFLAWLKVFANVIQKGQNDGEIRTDFAPIDLAEYLHAGFYGGFSRMLLTHSRDYHDKWFTMTFRFITTK